MALDIPGRRAQTSRRFQHLPRPTEQNHSLGRAPSDAPHKPILVGRNFLADEAGIRMTYQNGQLSIWQEYRWWVHLAGDAKSTQRPPDTGKGIAPGNRPGQLRPRAFDASVPRILRAGAPRALATRAASMMFSSP